MPIKTTVYSDRAIFDKEEIRYLFDSKGINIVITNHLPSNRNISFKSEDDLNLAILSGIIEKLEDEFSIFEEYPPYILCEDR